jgi:hypothetical protein
MQGRIYNTLTVDYFLIRRCRKKKIEYICYTLLMILVEYQ